MRRLKRLSTTERGVAALPSRSDTGPERNEEAI
jgi:hypothetical protein